MIIISISLSATGTKADYTLPAMLSKPSLQSLELLEILRLFKLIVIILYITYYLVRRTGAIEVTSVINILYGGREEGVSL